MRYVILDIGRVAGLLQAISRLLEPLRLALRGIGKTKPTAPELSTRQREAEEQARFRRARHDGEAVAVTMPYRLIR